MWTMIGKLFIGVAIALGIVGGIGIYHTKKYR
jgi:hypothetical protein